MPGSFRRTKNSAPAGRANSLPTPDLSALSTRSLCDDNIHFHLIEPKWQRFWDTRQTFRAWNPGDSIPPEHPFAKRHGLREKVPAAAASAQVFTFSNMFPYPSGRACMWAIRKAIRHRHPGALSSCPGLQCAASMGWDAFGLPAEQLRHSHRATSRKTTEENIGVSSAKIKIAVDSVIDLEPGN